MAKKSLPIAGKVETVAVDKDDDMKWRAKSAFDDIKRAEMHRSDKNLMKHVKKHARQEMKATKKICGE